MHALMHLKFRLMMLKASCVDMPNETQKLKKYSCNQDQVTEVEEVSGTALMSPDLIKSIFRELSS